MSNIIQQIEAEQMGRVLPVFSPGDTPFCKIRRSFRVFCSGHIQLSQRSSQTDRAAGGSEIAWQHQSGRIGMSIP